MSGLDFKRTQLRQLYIALADLKQSEQVALAQFHAEDPSMLMHRIKHDLDTVARYPSLRDTALVDDNRDPLPDQVDLAKISSTPQFAKALKDSPQHDVEGRPELAFSYLEREPSPMRGSDLERRHMDLLLLSSDGHPVLGEVKIATDNLPYYALVQLLVHLVELSSPTQRGRLEDLGVPGDASGRKMDLYLIAYGEPHKTHSGPSLRATGSIASQLMAREGSALRNHVRRIVYLKAKPTEGALVFKPEFVAQ